MGSKGRASKCETMVLEQESATANSLGKTRPENAVVRANEPRAARGPARRFKSAMTRDRLKGHLIREKAGLLTMQSLYPSRAESDVGACVSLFS